jgi:diguanylate cyclase (GGDEF)-like protein
MIKTTILVVDDEQFFLHLYSDMLKESHFIVETCNSGLDAIKRIQQGKIDIVLTDMVMPGVDGLEVLRVAQTQSNPPDVILVTGHASTESAIQALKNGARDYLTKPFDPVELLHLLRTCVEQRRLLNENYLLKTQIQLYQRGQLLASLIDIDRLLPQSITSLLQLFVDGRGIAFIFDKKGRPIPKSILGVEKEQAEAIARDIIALNSSVSGFHFLEKTELTPGKNWPENVETVGYTPLSCEGNIQGGLIVFNPVNNAFPERPYEEHLTFLSEQINLGFENAFRFSDVRELMYTDDLSGLFNHRYLHLAVEKEISRSSRYGLKFSLVFLDLDHFKQINDTHGHLAGSKALTEVATVLLESVREVDSVFRYGGDEFTALLIETDERGAKIVAERMRAAVENTVFLKAEGINTRVTTTIGYATYPDHADNKFSLIDMADQAMFYGKKTRNTSRSAGEKTD